MLYEVNQPTSNVVVYRGQAVELAKAQNKFNFGKDHTKEGSSNTGYPKAPQHSPRPYTNTYTATTPPKKATTTIKYTTAAPTYATPTTTTPRPVYHPTEVVRSTYPSKPKPTPTYKVPTKAPKYGNTGFQSYSDGNRLSYDQSNTYNYAPV